MKVLITGANGLLGQHLVKLLLEKNYQVFATGKGAARFSISQDQQQYQQHSYYEMDITDAQSVARVFAITQPEVVVHAAAMTQVDDCELNPGQCERTNVQGTAHVLTEAEIYSRHFIYISTDFVFDGEKGNYSEDDDLKPVSYYGFTKMQAEALVQTGDMPWSIVRTCLVYGNVLQGTRSNIISWVRDSLQQGKRIRVVSDQYRTPTYVEDLAKGISLIIDRKAEGVFHISGKDLLTPYDMAVKTAELLQLDQSLIEKVDASSFTQPGKRPPRTGFNIEKARRELGYEPLSFNKGLGRMLNLNLNKEFEFE
jgi:dTDP-4-dehydrorhamnose reductase